MTLADTIAELRRHQAAVLAAANPWQRDRAERPYVVALVNAAPDLLTAAEEAERLRAERDVWREKYERVTTYSRKAGNALMDATIADARSERDAAIADRDAFAMRVARKAMHLGLPDNVTLTGADIDAKLAVILIACRSGR